MRARGDMRCDGPLEVQSLYSIAALARAANVSPYLFRRLLRAKGVELIQAGRSLFVPLVELEAKIPLLWQSIQAAEMLRRGLE